MRRAVARLKVVMKEAPSMASVSVGSSVPSKTGSPVRFSKSATSRVCALGCDDRDVTSAGGDFTSAGRGQSLQAASPITTADMMPMAAQVGLRSTMRRSGAQPGSPAVWGGAPVGTTSTNQASTRLTGKPTKARTTAAVRSQLGRSKAAISTCTPCMAPKAATR